MHVTFAGAAREVTGSHHLLTVGDHTAGRILNHLKNDVSDPRNTVLILEFHAEHTLRRRIVERRPMLRILGDEPPLF